MLHISIAARPARAAILALLAVALAAVLPGCSSASAEEPVEPTRLVLASTTSTQDSGLFDTLIPAFEEAHPEYPVEVVAVGTGEALELGRRGDADVLLVHAKADEEEFVADGYGAERLDVMYNDFVVLGPEDDPAAVASTADAPGAFVAIEDAQATFVSRGDDSGTHKREMAIWEQAGNEPQGEWYLSVGQGMGDSLRLAAERDAYILCDRATFLANIDDVEIGIVFEKDEALYNQYGVIVVSDAANPEGAQAFADWLTSEDAQGLIGEFGQAQFGRALFVPNAEG
jgi:tungstate transport system substrate-binding protein